MHTLTTRSTTIMTLAALVFASLLATIQPATAAPTIHVIGTSSNFVSDGFSTSVTTTIAVPDGGVTAGNSIIIAASARTPGSSLVGIACRDSASNVYNVDVTALPTDNAAVRIFSAHGVSTLDNGHEISCTATAAATQFSLGQALALVALEVAGLAANPLVDTSGGGGATASGVFNSGDATAVDTNSLVIGAVSHHDDVVVDSAFTNTTAIGEGPVQSPLTAGHRVVDVGDYAYSGTTITTSAWAAVVAVYRPAAPDTMVEVSPFAPPVDSSPDAVNTIKAGRTVPLKFTVTIDGIEQTDPAVIDAFTITKVACPGEPNVVEEVDDVATTGGTSLRYDEAEALFIQNWKTPKRKGTCVQVTIEVDGTTSTALFQLT